MTQEDMKEEAVKQSKALTIAEVGLGPRRQGRLAVALAALGEGEGQRGRAAHNLPGGGEQVSSSTSGLGAPRRSSSSGRAAAMLPRGG